MSKEVEHEAFGHERVLEKRDLHFLEEREEALSFGRERKLGECFITKTKIRMFYKGWGNRFLIRKFWVEVFSGFVFM